MKNRNGKLLSRKLTFKDKTFDILLRSDADESVVAEIFDWQEYRAAEKIIKDDSSLILDVGAHIGIFSLYAKALNSAAQIYALEPEDTNFELLRKNLLLNHLEDVKVFKTALAGETGSGRLVLEIDSINHHLAGEGEEGENDKIMRVHTYSLEDFLKQNHISGVGLLKMDIEGGEYAVLEGVSADVFSKIHNVILEYHDYSGRSHKELEEVLRRNGFSVQIFPSRFERGLGFILARNKRKS